MSWLPGTATNVTGPAALHPSSCREGGGFLKIDSQSSIAGKFQGYKNVHSIDH